MSLTIENSINQNCLNVHFPQINKLTDDSSKPLLSKGIDWLDVHLGDISRGAALFGGSLLMTGDTALTFGTAPVLMLGGTQKKALSTKMQFNIML